MLTYNNHFVGKRNEYSLLGIKPYNLTLHSQGFGNFSARPLTGLENYKINLSATPDEYNYLDHYITDYGNVSNDVYTFANHDGNVTAVFQTDTASLPEWYYIYLDDRGNMNGAQRKLNGDYSWSATTYGENQTGHVYNNWTATHLEVRYDNMVCAHGGGFWNCSALTSLPSGKFKNLIDGNGIFMGCRSLHNIPSNTFVNLLSAYRMFEEASITSIPDNMFNKLVYAPNMFYYSVGWGGSTLTSRVGANCFNNLQNGSAMFRQSYFGIIDSTFDNLIIADNMFQASWCNHVPDNSFNKVLSANGMFSDSRLSALPQNSFKSLTNADNMFAWCTYMTGNAVDFITSHSSITSHSGTFKRCSGLNDYDYARTVYSDWF